MKKPELVMKKPYVFILAFLHYRPLAWMMTDETFLADKTFSILCFMLGSCHWTSVLFLIHMFPYHIKMKFYFHLYITS